MIKTFYFFLVALISFCIQDAFAQKGSFPGIFKNFKDANNGTVLVCAHRADWKHFPENSIASINGSINMGADFVEIDIRRSKDGVLVLMHDATVDRTTNGKGKVSQLTFSELKSLKLKNRDGSLTNERIPTFEEAMLAIKGNIMAILDIKINVLGNFSKIYNTLEKTGTLDHALWSVKSNLSQVQDTLKKYPGVIWCPKFGDYQPDPVGDFYAHADHLNLEVVQVRFQNETDTILSVIPYAKEKDLRIYGHTLFKTSAAGYHDPLAVKDPDAHWGHLIRKGLGIIMTDNVAEILEYLRANGLHSHLNGITTHTDTIRTSAVPVSADFIASGLQKGEYLWFESETASTPLSGASDPIYNKAISKTTTLWVSTVSDKGSNRVPVTVYVCKPEKNK